MMPENPNFDARVAAKREAEVCPDRWWPMFTQYDGGLFGERGGFVAPTTACGT